MRRAAGSNSIRISCRLPSSSVARMLIPVGFAPGRLSDCTSPAATMSSAMPTIGILRVAACAARTEASPEGQKMASTPEFHDFARRLRETLERNRNAAAFDDEVLVLDETKLEVSSSRNAVFCGVSSWVALSTPSR